MPGLFVYSTKSLDELYQQVTQEIKMLSERVTINSSLKDSLHQRITEAKTKLDTGILQKQTRKQAIYAGEEKSQSGKDKLSQEDIDTAEKEFIHVLRTVKLTAVELYLPLELSKDNDIVKLVHQLVTDIFNLFKPGSEEFNRLLNLVMSDALIQLAKSKEDLEKDITATEDEISKLSLNYEPNRLLAGLKEKLRGKIEAREDVRRKYKEITPVFERNLIEALKEIRIKQIELDKLEEDVDEQKKGRLDEAVKVIEQAYTLTQANAINIKEFKTTVSQIRKASNEDELNKIRLDIFQKTLRHHYPNPDFNSMIDKIVEEIKSQNEHVDDEIRDIVHKNGTVACNGIYSIYVKAIAKINKESAISAILVTGVLTNNITLDTFTRIIQKLKNVLSKNVNVEAVVEQAVSLVVDNAMTLDQFNILIDGLSHIAGLSTSLSTSENEPKTEALTSYDSLIQQLKVRKKVGEKSILWGQTLLTTGISLLLLGVAITASLFIVSIPFAIFTIEFALTFLGAGAITSGVGFGTQRKGFKILDSSEQCSKLADLMTKFQYENSETQIQPIVFASN